MSMKVVIKCPKNILENELKKDFQISRFKAFKLTDGIICYILNIKRNIIYRRSIILIMVVYDFYTYHKRGYDVASLLTKSNRGRNRLYIFTKNKKKVYTQKVDRFTKYNIEYLVDDFIDELEMNGDFWC